MQRIIGQTTIEHNGDVDHGLDYLDRHWNSDYVLEGFKAANDPQIERYSFRFPDIKGTYVLKYIGLHHFSLEWQED